jgi:hypothetical protein
LYLSLFAHKITHTQANIESEDWARRYKFDQVLWPSSSSSCEENTTTPNNNNNDDDDAIRKLAISMGNDAVHWGAPSMCLAVGGTNSDKTNTMFGGDTQGDYGLLGMVVERVLSQLSEHQVCTLSILEIVNEDELRDLLVVEERSSQNALVIRHGSKRGAAVHGLWDAPLDSMTGLGVSLLFGAFVCLCVWARAFLTPSLLSHFTSLSAFDAQGICFTFLQHITHTPT